VEKTDLNLLGPALKLYLAEFADVAIAPTRRLIEAYLRGQLGPLQRKSVLPMAQEAGIAPRTLQELLSLHRWDDRLLVQRLQEHVLRMNAGREAVATIIESTHRKRGNRTPGVELQRCEPGGRLRNCVALLHLGYSRDDFHCLLDNAVYLPAGWTDSPEKKATARIPSGVEYRTKRRIALEMLDRARANGFRPSWVYAGLEFASDAQFIQEIGSRGYGLVSARPFPLHGIPISVPQGRWAPDEIGGAAPETVSRVARSGEAALEAFEYFRREIGLDHFEVRTYLSLVRHLALSSASILFLAKLGLRVPQRRRFSASRTRAL
jgi:hypothetical protein